jgi:hypothetical protein
MAPAAQNRFRKKDLKPDSAETKDNPRPDVSKDTQFQYASLSFIESFFNWTAWICIVGYMIYKVLEASNSKYLCGRKCT